MKRLFNIEVNGKKWTCEAAASASLLDVLRDGLLLTGSKRGCDNGSCGACTVLVDGLPILSCLYPAARAEGKEVTTIEGLGTPDRLDPVQDAFVRHGAVQCGYCTPGMVMSAKGLLARTPSPSREEIQDGLSGNICRCTGYVRIVQAVENVAAGAPVDGVAWEGGE